MTSARVIALCNVLHIVLPNVDFIENKFDPVRCEEVNGASVDRSISTGSFEAEIESRHIDIFNFRAGARIDRVKNRNPATPN